MSLGLGNSITSATYLEDDYIDPSSISGLVLWVGFKSGIFADQNSSGDAVEHSTGEDNMASNDRISQWNDKSGNNNHAVQTTSADKPRWDTSGSGKDTGSVKFASAAKFMDLTSGITLTGDFTIQIRFRADNFDNSMSFVGNSTTDLFRAADATEFRAILGGSGASIFDETSATAMSSGTNTKRQIVTFTRSSGALSVHVNGGTNSGTFNDEQDDVNWAAAAGNTDSDTFTISNIGSAADDAENFRGWFYDVLIYDGIAISDAQIQLNYNYLNSQTI